MKELIAETSEEDFETFVEACRGWMDIFQLNDFNQTYTHAEMSDAAAAVHVCTAGRKADFTLCKTFPIEMKEPGFLDHWALHEVLHVLVADLVSSAKDRTATDDQQSNAEERLVVKLENVIRSLQ